MSSRGQKSGTTRILKFSKIYKMFIFDIFYIKSSDTHDPRVGTDAVGPGEAVFAIR